MGIKGLLGTDGNIIIALENPFILSEMKFILKKTKLKERYYLYEENIFGNRFHQVRRKGNIFTLGLPIVAFDRLYGGSDYLEIRGGVINSPFYTECLTEYPRMRYGHLELKV